ncbi:MAG: hypothetical protein M0R17_07610 [Candidatus Omnitrophica bacterium]|jgi:hypothetical protein|nr:hypothetical protein [Candidatus Omnitrophota bacterium]
MNYQRTDDLARSLVKHGLYSTFEEARLYSINWHRKEIIGLVESLPCPHRPDIKITTTHSENGSIIVEYDLSKNQLKNNLILK